MGGKGYGFPASLPSLFPVGNLRASTVSRQEMRFPIWVPLVDPGVPDHKLTQNFFNIYFSQKFSRFFVAVGYQLLLCDFWDSQDAEVTLI